jgi:hypothetical protein
MTDYPALEEWKAYRKTVAFTSHPAELADAALDEQVQRAERAEAVGNKLTPESSLPNIFDQVLEHVCLGNVTEFRDAFVFFLDDTETEACESGCGDFTTEAIRHDVEGVPVCMTCYDELVREANDREAHHDH